MINYTFTIKKAELIDASSIKKIMISSFKIYQDICEKNHVNDGTFKLDALEESITDIENDILHKKVFIAFIDDIPVGTVRIKLIDSQFAYISRFGVVPQYHNIGIGKSLMNLVDKYLISENIKSVYLYTASSYTDLVRFYYGRGFYVDSTTKNRGYVRAKMIKNYL